MLDPRGNHGQGSIFLKCFLEELVKKKCDLPLDWETRVDHGTVTTEACTSFLSTNARRIDIRIELGQDFGIGIENKPWAIEQTAQLADYWNELDRRYRGQFVLIFLCQRGRIPTSITDADWKALQDNRKCAILEYSVHFLTWLVNCQEKSQADKIRHFLKDFEKFVRSTLGGEIPLDDLHHAQ